MPSVTLKIKSLVYCRVSSKEQKDTGYSLEAQEKFLNDYAGDKNYEVGKIFKLSESASGNQLRKAFNEVLEYATKNKVDIILCEKIDRLTRNLKDAALVDDWVRAKPGREVHFVKENFVLNGQTKAHENLVWDMKVAIARFYTNNLSEEVHKGQKEKLAEGWLPTKPPLGYKTIGDKGKKTHIINEAEAPFIRQMFEWYATGNYSVLRLWKELHKAGLRSRSGRKVPTSRIHKLLTDPFYYGKIRWLGQIYPGKHVPLISKDLFGKVQIILKRHTSNPHLSKHNPLFKSKIYCEHCGGMVTWETQKGHWYGHCNNHPEYRNCPKKTYIREERVKGQLIPFFEHLAPKSEKILSWIEGIIKEEHAQKITSRENEIARIRELLDQVRRRKDRMYEDKIDGVITLEMYNRKFAEYTAEEGNFETSLAQVSDKSDEYQQLGVVVHELAYKAKQIYEVADVDEKRLLMSQIFTNLVKDGDEIKPNFTLAAKYLADWMPGLNEDYEPEKTLSVKGKAEVFTSAHPHWLRG
ncbi:MAG: recombinase family protein [Candidatus Yanofskybacteria bacterium]|nr:recombinase family protein [Candidatus Yanofskybacteria bacterium]